VFALTAIVGTVVIAWIWRAIGRAAPES
jgi:hypothetical protein